MTSADRIQALREEYARLGENVTNLSDWADNDWRADGRQVRIVGISETHATVEVIAARNATGDKARTGHQTRIRLDRFRPASTGYRLVRNADVSAA